VTAAPVAVDAAAFSAVVVDVAAGATACVADVGFNAAVVTAGAFDVEFDVFVVDAAVGAPADAATVFASDDDEIVAPVELDTVVVGGTAADAAMAAVPGVELNAAIVAAGAFDVTLDAFLMDVALGTAAEAVTAVVLAVELNAAGVNVVVGTTALEGC